MDMSKAAPCLGIAAASMTARSPLCPKGAQPARRATSAKSGCSACRSLVAIEVASVDVESVGVVA